MRRLMLLFALPSTMLLTSAPLFADPDWSVVASPSSNDCALRAVAPVSADDVWAVGSHQSESYENQTLILHWTGGTWSIVPGPNPNPSCPNGNVQFGGNALNALAVVSSTDIWAVGEGCYPPPPQTGPAITQLVEHWDGTSWSVVTVPDPIPGGESVLSDVAAVSASDVWAVGYTSETIGAGTLIEHWDGTHWSVVPSPHPGTGGVLSAVAANSATNAWAIGAFYDDGPDVWKTLILHWNGEGWSQVESPSVIGGFGDIAIVSSNDVWAVGVQSNGGTKTLIEHWNGTTWSVVPSPNPGPSQGSTSLGSISAVTANNIWAAGSYHNQDTDLDQHRTLIMHWDGASWSIEPTPTPGKSADLADIAVLPTGEGWAVGIFSDYPINTYDGTYTLPQTLVLNGANYVAGVAAPQVSATPTLGPATPNPMIDQVSFTIRLPRRAQIELGIYDVSGRAVCSLLSGTTEAGERAATWNGRGSSGRPGVYFARLTVDGQVVGTRPVALLGSSGTRDR